MFRFNLISKEEKPLRTYAEPEVNPKEFYQQKIICVLFQKNSLMNETNNKNEHLLREEKDFINGQYLLILKSTSTNQIHYDIHNLREFRRSLYNFHTHIKK